LRQTPSASPIATGSSSRQAEARWIASAIGLVDFPSSHRAFQAPALHALYDEQQRERAAVLDATVHASHATLLERHRDLAA
jgi:hypothetical protein